ncbi:hypothetical protein BCR43DRAFT_134086 [Syncephalastrum racemosum]|uniref:Uncharacterized protein n=1 Tax=Syncephalastrum racemosum TaxID=13706 RepID=A0A1X2HLF6_SYNRA|nr:hypothetical protein BCR43DRAFT_134086 [Syncephalastrum racemosum]
MQTYQGDWVALFGMKRAERGTYLCGQWRSDYAPNVYVTFMYKKAKVRAFGQGRAGHLILLWRKMKQKRKKKNLRTKLVWHLRRRFNGWSHTHEHLYERKKKEVIDSPEERRTMTRMGPLKRFVRCLLFFIYLTCVCTCSCCSLCPALINNEKFFHAYGAK